MTLGDVLYLTTHDGKSLFVPDSDIRFIVYGNFGAPPVNFITRRGYKQHGATEVDYLLEPRTITVELWKAPACSRQQYWDNRLALHEFLRHNRNGPITFVLREPEGAKRALTVRANPGLSFPMPSADINNWNVDEQIDFIAFDPIWFDPSTPPRLVVSGLPSDLVFPITFPIQFGPDAGSVSTATIVYGGTWPSYPKITLTGPFTAVTLTNLATGTVIILSVAVAGNGKRIIDLTPGAQSVVDEVGASRFADLGTGSDLVNFSIRPDPQVPGGIQKIQATFINGLVGVSTLQIDYYHRYFAL